MSDAPRTETERLAFDGTRAAFVFVLCVGLFTTCLVAAAILAAMEGAFLLCRTRRTPDASTRCTASSSGRTPSGVRTAIHGAAWAHGTSTNARS